LASSEWSLTFTEAIAFFAIARAVIEFAGSWVAS